MFVVHRLSLVDLTQPFVDGFHDMAAEGEPAFAGGGFCRDEEEQVGIDRAVGVDAPDVRKAGGDDGHRAEGEDVGILRGVGDGCDFFEETREVAGKLR